MSGLLKPWTQIDDSQWARDDDDRYGIALIVQTGPRVFQWSVDYQSGGHSMSLDDARIAADIAAFNLGFDFVEEPKLQKIPDIVIRRGSNGYEISPIKSRFDREDPI